MLKRITVAAAVLAVLLSGGTARAIVVCDGDGIEYNVKASLGELLFGTATNLPCGGSARLVGSYKRIPEGFFFSIYVDQDPTQPACCEGFEIIGIWANNAGAGNWYDSREIKPACFDTGTFTLAPCGAAPLRSEPQPYPPGLRD